MNIDIETVREHLDYRKEVNECKLDEIELYLKGIKVDLNNFELSIEDFNFTGLSTMDFIQMIIGELYEW